MRESTSNILRHSGASQERIIITAEMAGADRAASPMTLTIVIEDDGCTPPEAWRISGNGLANMRHRIEACGGTMILTRGQSTTCLQAILPLTCERPPVALDGRAVG